MADTSLPFADPPLVEPVFGDPADGRARSRQTLTERAYTRCEEMIVTCRLRPGQYLSIHDIQEATGLGRTPTHQAVSRLAADTLLQIRPRHGLQVAPVDLTRERTLLHLRRDLERFVLRLAAERVDLSIRNQLLHIRNILSDQAATLTIAEFNRLDRQIDQLVTAAAGEPFLEHTLRPLHTIFRRIGWIYHCSVKPGEGLQGTIQCHIDMLDAIAGRRMKAAIAAADGLITFVESMFDTMEAGIDPALLDCNAALLAAD